MLRILTELDELNGRVIRATMAPDGIFNSRIVLMFDDAFAVIEIDRGYDGDVDIALASEFDIATEQLWQKVIHLGIANAEDFRLWRERQKVISTGTQAYHDRVEWAEYCRLKVKWEGRSAPP